MVEAPPGSLPETELTLTAYSAKYACLHPATAPNYPGFRNAKRAPLHTKRPSKWLTTALPLSLILLAGIYPYRFALNLWPTTRDAATWIARGSLAGPDWLDWIFFTRHFRVGYRPVTALSYTLNDLIGGLSALPYRLTDLALHAACGLLIYLLYRRLAPALPRWGGLVATGIFVAHPIAEQVVPHLARRSYSLATFFGLAALLALIPRDSMLGAPLPTSRLILRSLPGGLLLVCALLSNETALLTAAMLPLLLVWSVPGDDDRWRTLLATSLAPGTLVAATLILRSTIIADGVGGYTTGVDHLARLFPIASATWRSLGAVAPVPGAPPGVLSWITLIAFTLVTMYYLTCWFARPLRNPTGGVGMLPALLILWILGYVLLFAPLGVWFPRQVYIVLVPFALLVGVALAQTVSLHAENPGLMKTHLVPQLLLVLLIFLQSPVFRGADPLRVAAFRDTDQVLRQMHAAIDDLAEPSRVQFAIPYFVRPETYAFRAREGRSGPPRPGRQAEIWMRALFRGRAFSIDYALVFERNPLEPEPPLVFLMDEGHPAIELPIDRHFYAPSTTGGTATRPDTLTLRIGPPPSPGTGPRQLYFFNVASGAIYPLDAD